MNAGEEAFFQWRRRNDSSRCLNGTASRDVSSEKKRHRSKAVVRKGRGDETTKEIDRVSIDGRVDVTDPDVEIAVRTRERRERSRGGWEARPRTRGSLRPIAWSPRPATARANRGRARPTPAAGAGLRLPRGHAPPPESARASRVTAPPRAKSIDQWPGTRTRAWFNAGDGHCLLPPRGGGVGVGTKDLRGAHPSAPPPSGARARSTAREADDERGAVSSADTCEQQFSRIIPVA